MQIQLSQIRIQVDRLQEFERELQNMEAQLEQIVASSTLKQEQFIHMRNSLVNQKMKIYDQMNKLHSLKRVLETTLVCVEQTEDSIVQIYSGNQYRYVRPDIRRMIIQGQIPLPGIVLD